ncbi:MAG: glycosyltransferase family 39 protein [Planctomycetota bacterium]
MNRAAANQAAVRRARRQSTAKAAAVAHRNWTGRQLWCLFALTLLAAGLRMLCLGDWSMWVDEAHSWRDATMRWDGPGSFLESDRSRYPSTFVLLRALLQLGLGDDEWSLRLPFAFVGILTVPLMAICGRRLVGAWPAICAAAILVVDPWHLFWSQNARGYALMLPFCVMAVHRAEVFRSRGGLGNLMLLVLLLAAGSSCHPTAAILAVGLFGYLVLRSLSTRVRSVVVRVGLVLLIAGLLAVSMPWAIRQYAPFQGFLAAKSNPSILHFAETVLYYFRPALLLLVLLGMLLMPSVLGSARALLLTSLFMVPLLALSVVGFQLVKVTARYALPVLPIACWLAGLVVVEIARRLRARSDESRLAILALSLCLPALVTVDRLLLDVSYYRSQHGQRGQWRTASEFVEKQAELRGRKGVRVLTTSEPTLLYYLRRQHWFGIIDPKRDPYPNTHVHATLEWEFFAGEDQDGRRLHEPGPAAHLAWHRAAADRGDQLFAIVVTQPPLAALDRDGAIAGLLQRDYELVLHLPCWIGPKDESVYVYLPKR